MMRTSVRALLCGAWMIAGCAGPGANAPNSQKLANSDEDPAPKPANANKPPPPKTTQEEAAPQKPEPVMAQKAPPVKRVAATDRADFDKAYQRWEDAKKAGPISQKACAGLAEGFTDAAKHADVAAQAHFNAG